MISNSIIKHIARFCVLTLGFLVPVGVLGVECSVPSLGDWTVSVDCTISTDTTLARNVQVNSPATITIQNNSTLFVDMEQYRVTVKQGAGILIKEGSSLKQSGGTAPNPDPEPEFSGENLLLEPRTVWNQAQGQRNVVLDWLPQQGAHYYSIRRAKQEDTVGIELDCLIADLGTLSFTDRDPALVSQARWYYRVTSNDPYSNCAAVVSTSLHNNSVTQTVTKWWVEFSGQVVLWWNNMFTYFDTLVAWLVPTVHANTGLIVSCPAHFVSAWGTDHTRSYELGDFTDMQSTSLTPEHREAVLFGINHPTNPWIAAPGVIEQDTGGTCYMREYLQPHNNLTRAELAVVVYKASLNNSRPRHEVDSIYTDLDLGYSWAKEAVRSLSSDGVVSGYIDSSGGIVYRPAQSVREEEALKVVLRGLGAITNNPNNTPCSVSQFDHWYSPYLQIAQERGLIDGDGQVKIDPGAFIDRKDLFLLMHKVYQYTQEHGSCYYNEAQQEVANTVGELVQEVFREAHAEPADYGQYFEQYDEIVLEEIKQTVTEDLLARFVDDSALVFQHTKGYYLNHLGEGTILTSKDKFYQYLAEHVRTHRSFYKQSIKKSLGKIGPEYQSFFTRSSIISAQSATHLKSMGIGIVTGITADLVRFYGPKSSIGSHLLTEQVALLVEASPAVVALAQGGAGGPIGLVFITGVQVSRAVETYIQYTNETERFLASVARQAYVYHYTANSSSVHALQQANRINQQALDNIADNAGWYYGWTFTNQVNLNDYWNLAKLVSGHNNGYVTDITPARTWAQTLTEEQYQIIVENTVVADSATAEAVFHNRLMNQFRNGFPSIQ